MTRKEMTKELSEMTEKLINPYNEFHGVLVSIARKGISSIP